MSLADKMSGKGKVVETNNVKVIKVDTTAIELLIEQRTKDIMAFVQKEIAKWNNLTFTTLEKAIAELKEMKSIKPVTVTTTEKPITEKPAVNTTNIENAFRGIENVPQYIPEVLDHIRKRIDISKVDKESWIIAFMSAYSSIKGKVRGRPLGDDKLKDIANTIYSNIVSTKEKKTETTKEPIQGIKYWTKLFDLEKGELQSFIDGMLDSEVDISDLRTKEGRSFVLDQLGIECNIEDRKAFFSFLEKCIEESE